MLRFTSGFATDEWTANAMGDTMAHRGPDDGGVWTDDEAGVALVHRRLSIVDLSPAGRGPMSNEDNSIWITYNGEIYNHKNLRDNLEARGHSFRSCSDTEVILHLWEEAGPRCVDQLRGMWAFAIWDSKRRILFLARDRLGIKPLYYAHTPGGLVFGSEIKALLMHPAVTRDLDEDAFHHYLTFVCTPAPMTMFSGISKLAPAESLLTYPSGVCERNTYWRMSSAATVARVTHMSHQERLDQLVALLCASVESALAADVPTGVLLSGGVDSSTIVALANRVAGRSLPTFSVAFSENRPYSELAHARTVAGHFKTDHHELVLDEADARTALPTLVHHQDEPTADWVGIPLYHIARLARESGIGVVQMGDGADELLQGYDSYRSAAVRQGLWLQEGGADGAAADCGRMPWWGGAICWCGSSKRRLTRAALPPDSYRIVEQLWRRSEYEIPGAELLQRMSVLDMKQRLAEVLLMRVDKMTMAASLEARVPYLDHELVDFGLALPAHEKVRGDVGKAILKEALEPILGRKFVHRRKQGFGAPMARWLRGDLGVEIQRAIRSSSLAERGLLDYDYVDTTWQHHRSGQSDRSLQLWSLWSVSAWHDRWIAGRPTAQLF